MSKLYFSFDDVKNSLHNINRQLVIDSWTPNIVIGPGRGAYVFGVMLSHYWNVPFEGFTWQTRDGNNNNIQALEKILLDLPKGSNVLVVDDINDTGSTLLGISRIIESQHTLQDVRYATIFNKTTSQFKDIDYTSIELTPDYDPWVVFPYEQWWNQN